MVTIRQTIATKKVIEGMPIAQAMREANYALSTANATTKLTKSDGFQELMAKHLPEKLVLKTHKALLRKKEIIREYNHATGEYEMVKTNQPHSDTAKAIDMAYKLKGSYAPDKHLNLNASLSEALDALDEYETTRQENKANPENTTT